MNQQVQELLEYLEQSGTGKAKIKALAKLSESCSNGAEFLQRAPEVVPEGTMKKILEFTGPPPAEPTTAPNEPVEEEATDLEKPGGEDSTPPQEEEGEGKEESKASGDNSSKKHGKRNK